MTQDERCNRIERCMKEINRCVSDSKPGLFGGQLHGAVLGELDWLEELHYLLYEDAAQIDAHEKILVDVRSEQEYNLCHTGICVSKECSITCNFPTLELRS